MTTPSEKDRPDIRELITPLHEPSSTNQLLTSDSTRPNQPESEPPNGGYGWVCAACVFLINAHTWGVNCTYGVFLAHYISHQTFPGATTLDYSFVGGLSISKAFLIAPLTTFITRVYGSRTSLCIGIFLETIALLGASWSKEIWQLFLSQGLCFGFGMGFLFVASVGIVPQWFTTRRSFANAIAAGGAGIGGLIYSLSTEQMIQSISLAWAFRILAIVAFTVNIVSVLLLRDRNKEIGSSQDAFDFELLQKPEYLLLLAWGFLSLLGYIVLLFSLPNYSHSINLSSSQGSTTGALLNLGTGLGRPLVGFYSDKFGRMNLAAICTFLAGLFTLAIWIFAKSYGMLIFFALVVGIVAGTIWTVAAPITAEVVGLKRLPAALSVFWLVLVLPCTFSEAIGLQLSGKGGKTYIHAQVFVGCMYIGAGICMCFLRAWKIGELEGVSELVVRVNEVAKEEDKKKLSVRSAALIKRMFRWQLV